MPGLDRLDPGIQSVTFGRVVSDAERIAGSSPAKTTRETAPPDAKPKGAA
jgi:hypothetical protein